MNVPATRFPSLRISAEHIEAQGAFAESQVKYLAPDPEVVERLSEALSRQRIGVVAHFYMDPEIQGVLAASSWPHIQVSDSLVMADRAVAMARAGMKAIVVLGVDFMAENARAMLDAAGFAQVPVYRLAEEAIGCSLAEAAEAPAYERYLEQAAQTPHSLHVVYINTSLRTKARAQALVPTLTCTSSNVIASVLQAFVQVPEVQVWFGPDTYMGQNLAHYFRTLAASDESLIRSLKPAVDRALLRRVVEGFHHFQEGACIVHHLFGREVVAQLRQDYPDALVAAHLEVPSEMFGLALEAQGQGRGVIGSTSNILSFIEAEAAHAARERAAARRIVLGTEAGMITPIVRSVQRILREQAGQDPQGVIEIVFPVAAEAITPTGFADLPLVPGVMQGEGCSTAGGCATCPYMKMNTLWRLFEVLERIERGQERNLLPLEPQIDRSESFAPLLALAQRPILSMRHFQTQGELDPELVEDIRQRKGREPNSLSVPFLEPKAP